jgi:hypothetical protein
MQFSKLWLCGLLVAGCSFKSVAPPETIGDGAGAPFIFTPVTAVQVETLQVDPASGLPTSKAYHLKACAVDRASKLPITGQVFTLQRGGVATALAPTDGLGCVYWSEPVRFRARVKSQVFVSLPRKLTTQSSTLDLPLAANPWLDGPHGFADLRTVKLAIEPVAADRAERTLMGNLEGDQGPSHSFQTDGSRGSFNGAKFDKVTTNTTVGFSAEVRVVDPADHAKPLPGAVFEYLVSTTPEWPIGTVGKIATTNSSGDLPVQGELTYLDLSREPETYQRRFILLRGHQEGVEETRSVEIQINPWQRGDLFYRDMRRQGAPAYQADTGKAAHLKVQSYSAYFLKRVFDLNEHLQLTTVREWNLTFKPTLARPNPTGKAEPQALQPGTRFKLSAVLIDPMVDTSRQAIQAFLSAYETEVEIDEQNQINTPLAFAIDFINQARLDSRARLQVTLTPLSPGPGLVAPLEFSAPFVSNPNGNDNSSGETIAAEEKRARVDIPFDRVREIPAVGGPAYVIRVDLGKAPLLLFEDYWKEYGPLTSVALSEPPKGWTDWKAWSAGDKHWDALSGFVQSDGEGLAAKAPGLLANFCSIKSGFSATEAAQCLKAPTEFFHLNHFTVVEKVINDTPLVSGTNNYFGALAVSFFNEHQQTDRVINADKNSEHFVAGVATKLGYGLLGNEATVNTAFNKELEWYKIVESASGDGQRSRVSSVDTITLSKEEIALNLHLLVRTCALVRPQRFVLAVSQNAKAPLQSVLICSAPQKRRSFKESWFSVRDRWNAVHSALTDPKDPRERGWTKMIRGAKAFTAFERVIRDGTRSFYFQKVNPFIDGVDTFVSPAFDPAQEARLARDGGIFPGVLRAEESTPVQWSEAQIRHYVGESVVGFKEIAGGNEAKIELAGRLAFCIYEAAARRWDHQDFVRNAKAFRALLKADGTHARCVQYMNAGGIL